jgi:hypothetical protein
MSNKNLSRISVLFSLCLLVVSCEDEEKTTIAPEFATYVNRFVAEAQQRGRTISVENLDVKFGTLIDLCGQAGMDPPRVEIDKTCWNNSPEMAQEALMFHELGHAILRRGHDNGILPNGDYESIMYKDPHMLYNEYTPEKRAYYLDELFNALNGLPPWTSAKVNESTILNDDISSTPGAWTYKVSDGANHVGDVESSNFSSAPYSLAIHSNASARGFSSWSYSWTPQGIETGSELLLKVKIKAEGLTEGGAFFAFRADAKEETEYPIFFYTTQSTPVLGNAEFGVSEYSVKVNYFPLQVERLNIFLILDGASTGTVYFDDIQLLKYHN